MNTPSKKSTVTMEAKELSNAFSAPSNDNKIDCNWENDHENDDSDDDLFRIQSKPSTTSTTPSTDDESETGDDDESFFGADPAATDINYECQHPPHPYDESLSVADPKNGNGHDNISLTEGRPKGDQPQTSKAAPTSDPVVERRRFVDPKELSFLHQSNAAGSSNNTYNYKSNKDSISALPPPTTAFGKGMRTFGRKKNKTLIQRRKEELGQKFGESNGRGATFVKRKTWSQKSTNGTYQRKTVVDKVYINNVYLK